MEMKKHGYRANEISKLKKIDFIKLIREKEDLGLNHLKKMIDAEFEKREKESSRNLNSGYKHDSNRRDSTNRRDSSNRKLNQSHDTLRHQRSSKWDDTFKSMQSNIDGMRRDIKTANE